MIRHLLYFGMVLATVAADRPAGAQTPESPETAPVEVAPSGGDSSQFARKRHCKIAVLDLEAGDGFTQKGASALTNVITTEIGKYAGCQVLSRSEIRSIISFEAEKQLLGCDDESCLAELGGALGVGTLVTGSVSKIGDSTLISLKKLDLTNLTVTGRTTDTFDGEGAELVAFAAWMAHRLVAPDGAGQKPVATIKKKEPAGGSGKVSLVEKKQTIWRTLAWTGLFATGLAGLVTAGAMGGAYGAGMIVANEKVKKSPDRSMIQSANDTGPLLASAGNLSLYITAALLVPAVILFFLPGEEIVTTELQVPQKTGAQP